MWDWRGQDWGCSSVTKHWPILHGDLGSGLVPHTKQRKKLKTQEEPSARTKQGHPNPPFSLSRPLSRQEGQRLPDGRNEELPGKEWHG